jgi:hypothetical protein
MSGYLKARPVVCYIEVPFKAGLTVCPWCRANYTRSAGLLLFIQSCVRVMSEDYGSYSLKARPVITDIMSGYLKARPVMTDIMSGIFKGKTCDH